MNDHLTIDVIDRLILGLATDSELDQWLAHLEQCDQCLDAVDQTWSGTKSNEDDLIPNLDPRRMREVRTQMFRRIHKLEVLKESLRFVALGPLAFLQGMFGSRQR